MQQTNLFKNIFRRIDAAVVFSALVFLTSCYSSNAERLSGSGNVTRETHNVSSFNALNLAVVFDVVIIPSDIEEVVVETDDNLQDLVLVENKGDELVVKMKPQANISRKTQSKIFIYVKELEGITNSSVGTLENEDILRSNTLTLNNSAVGRTTLKIETTDLTIKNSAVGSTELQGNCNTLKIKNSAVGKLNASELQCNYLDIDNHSVGRTSVFANIESVINNSAIGTLDLYGQGVIKKINNSGIGRFNKH
jgi:hypothetical protein